MSTLDLFAAGTRVEEGRLASGLKMRWYEHGPSAGAPVAVFLHGFPELAVSWRAQLAGLSDSFRVVAPDMRGYGGTDAPSRVRDYAIERLVRDVTELADLIDAPRIHLVGHDWGGAVAWEVARRAPDRLHSLAVLNCPPIEMMARAMMRPRQLRRSWYVLLFQIPGLAERWVRRDPEKMVRASFRGTAANKEPFTPEALAPYAEQIRERGLPGINYYRAAMRRPQVRSEPVEVPTRLIWGKRDRFLGPWFAEPDRYRAFVPDFELTTIDEAAHWVQQEAAPEVNRALREHWERPRD